MTKVKLNPSEWKKIKTFLQTRTDLYLGQPSDCKRFIEGVLFIRPR